MRMACSQCNMRGGRWVDDNEKEVMVACQTDIEIGDTAVGRLEKKRKADFA